MTADEIMDNRSLKRVMGEKRREGAAFGGEWNCSCAAAVSPDRGYRQGRGGYSPVISATVFAMVENTL